MLIVGNHYLFSYAECFKYLQPIGYDYGLTVK